MRVVEEKMYPRIKLVGTFDPRYATITEPASASSISPGCVYIERVDGWLCVFKKTKDGKVRRGHYKHMIDAVYAAHCKR
jgi:hypothetical protein